MQEKGFVIVTTAIDSEAEAKRLASLIIEAALAACVQYMPIHSVYRWKGRVESAGEYLLQAKTTRSVSEQLMDFIRKNHTYELPEIIITRMDGGLQSYLEWIEKETSRSRANGKNSND